MTERGVKRFTVGQMFKKYKDLHDRSYETVVITEVLKDLHRIIRERKIPKEDL